MDEFKKLQEKLSRLYNDALEVNKQTCFANERLQQQNTNLEQKVKELNKQLEDRRLKTSSCNKCQQLASDLLIAKNHVKAMKKKFKTIVSFFNKIQNTDTNSVHQLMTQQLLIHDTDLDDNKVNSVQHAVVEDIPSEMAESQFFSQIADHVGFQKMSTCVEDSKYPKTRCDELLSKMFGVESPIKTVTTLDGCEPITREPPTAIDDTLVLDKPGLTGTCTTPVRRGLVIPETVAPEMDFLEIILDDETSPQKTVTPPMSPVISKRRNWTRNTPELVKTPNSPVFVSNRTTLGGSPERLRRCTPEEPNTPLMSITNILISPVKRKASPSEDKDSPIFKKTRPTPQSKSPKKKLSQLKQSNNLQVEMTSTGFRKLKQTKLNLDCFKSKNKTQENLPAIEEECLQRAIQLSLKTQQEAERDDDIIIQSPNSEAPPSSFTSKTKSGSQQKLTVPKLNLRYDPDETRLSPSLLVQQPVATTRKEIVKPVDNSYDRLPEEEDVHFAYKRGAVRKKNERMQLPGNECPECQPYFEQVQKEEGGEMDMRKLLNTCSRHRDKHPAPSTPEGFWKPFFTPSFASD